MERRRAWTSCVHRLTWSGFISPGGGWVWPISRSPGAGGMEALRGRVQVVQGEAGSVAQSVFEASASMRKVPGPTAIGHLVAARQGVNDGLASVTIEPVARALGLSFHPLALHDVQIWVASEFVDDAVVDELLSMVASRHFRGVLAGVGGYELDGSGRRLN